MDLRQNVRLREDRLIEFTAKIVTLCFPSRCVGCDSEISPFQPIEHLQTPGNADLKIDNSDVPHLDSDRGTSLQTSFDIHWCQDCWRQLNQSGPEECRQCGAYLYHKSPLKNACSICHGFEFLFERAIATGNYRGLLQELVIRMKNQRDEQIAVQLGTLLADKLIRSDFVNDLNLIIPVPTHWWRRMRRGFQAAELVSETIARGCNIPYAGQIMRCRRGTKKQGTLSTAGRFKNVRGAFEVRATDAIKGQNILLVDDVLTSGATASELSRELLRQGAAKVYVGVIARGARVS